MDLNGESRYSQNTFLHEERQLILEVSEQDNELNLLVSPGRDERQDLCFETSETSATLYDSPSFTTSPAQLVVYSYNGPVTVYDAVITGTVHPGGERLLAGLSGRVDVADYFEDDDACEWFEALGSTRCQPCEVAPSGQCVELSVMNVEGQRIVNPVRVWGEDDAMSFADQPVSPCNFW